MKTKLVAGTTALLLVVVLPACSQKQQERFKDAPRGSTNSAPADTITFPDGFSNVATKCDHGNRVYVLFKGDSAYGSVSVVPADPTCRGGSQ